MNFCKYTTFLTNTEVSRFSLSNFVYLANLEERVFDLSSSKRLLKFPRNIRSTDICFLDFWLYLVP